MTRTMIMRPEDPLRLSEVADLVQRPIGRYAPASQRVGSLLAHRRAPWSSFHKTWLDSLEAFVDGTSDAEIVPEFETNQTQKREWNGSAPEARGRP